MWPCQYCGRENDETSTFCENCGADRDDRIGDSGDNKDSEDLFFDDEGICRYTNLWSKCQLWRSLLMTDY